MFVNKHFAYFTGVWLKDSWDWGARFSGWYFRVGESIWGDFSWAVGELSAWLRSMAAWGLGRGLPGWLHWWGCDGSFAWWGQLGGVFV